MATINVSDSGGSTQLSIKDDSILGEFKLENLAATPAGFVVAQMKPITDPGFSKATLSATFERPKIAFEGKTLDVKAAMNSAINVARTSDSPLFGKDDYDDPISIAGKDCWTSFELDTLLDATLEVPLSHGFGLSFEKTADPTFTTYLEISGDVGDTTTVGRAVEETLNAFKILASSADVLGIPEGVIHTSGASGSVTIGGSWSLPISVNNFVLASAKLPLNSSLSLKPALTVKVAGDISLKSQFEIRVRKASATSLRIGSYKTKGATVDVSFTAKAGLAADADDTDLYQALLKAIAPNVDVKELITNADLDPSYVADIQKVVKDSIDQSLSVSVNAAFSSSNSHESAVVYEIDIAGQDRGTKDAIDSALAGDWTGVSKLPNAKKVRDVITESVETKRSLRINLLGLLNYATLTDFVASMRTVSTDDGSIVITDKATATTITAATAPLAADKLRKVLYSSFLATATYQAALDKESIDVKLAAEQDFFEYHNSLGFEDALKRLKTGEVLGVLPQSVIQGLSAFHGDVQHPHFAASCQYSQADVLKFFFSDTDSLTPRTTAGLIEIGRLVLASLLDPHDPVDQKRISILRDTSDGSIWSGFNDNPATIPAPYSADWLDINDWADSVAKVGPLLKDTVKYCKTVPIGTDATKDAQFQNKQKAVLAALGSSMRNSEAAFDKSFSLCVMATLAGRTPGTPAPSFEAGWNGKTIFESAAQVVPAQLAAGAGGQ